MIEFFLDMIPPTATHQEKKLNKRAGTLYEPPRVKDARAKLTAHLAQHTPAEQLTGALSLTAVWCFPLQGKHKDGEPRTSKPDTDNLQKLLKDCMTACRYWKDDAQVAEEIVRKVWSKRAGIYIRVACIEE